MPNIVPPRIRQPTVEESKYLQKRGLLGLLFLGGLIVASWFCWKDSSIFLRNIEITTVGVLLWILCGVLLFRLKSPKSGEPRFYDGDGPVIR